MEREEKKFFDAPVLGAAYYPEDWDESEQDQDIAAMKEAGLKCVRIAEFAWHKMEPKEGQFDFSWMHRVMEKLWNAGISVVLGTPSATPPKPSPQFSACIATVMVAIYSCANRAAYRPRKNMSKNTA